MIQDIPDWMLAALPEDLPIPYHDLAKKIGVESTLQLARLYGGITIYLPKLDTSLVKFRDQLIKQEYTRYNAKELAIKYGVTDSWIRRLISVDDPDQLTLFGKDDLGTTSTK